MASCTVVLNDSAGVTATFNASLQSINHIIFMLQENRGFDHYFGHLNAYRQSLGLPANVDGTPADASNPNKEGTGTIVPFEMVSACMQSQSPFWNESHRDRNLTDPLSITATLDGFVTVAADDAEANGYNDTEGMRAMAYYDDTTLPYYYFMASKFATSDAWFSPVMTRTQPNRMYLLASTSAGRVYPLPSGSQPLSNPTIFDLLQAAGISWRVYVTDSADPLYEGSALNMFSIASKFPDNFVPASQFMMDADNGTLPQVAMIEPGYNSGLDEHPETLAHVNNGNVQLGSNYVSGLINDLMASQSWKDSVFILTWDEGGGYYDHIEPHSAVPPDDDVFPTDLQPTDYCYGDTTDDVCAFKFTGYRIPLIVISPFTAANYVSHTPADYTAISRLIEKRFGLASLTARDAAQMDMSEFFDFAHEPWLVPPTPPLQPTNAPCDVDTLP